MSSVLKNIWQRNSKRKLSFKSLVALRHLPSVGPALGQHGINIGEFVKRFNDATQDRRESRADHHQRLRRRTFDFITKIAPTSELIKKAAGISERIGSR